MVGRMASSSAQITLGELGVTRFTDLTPQSWRTIFKRGDTEELRWLIHLGLFYQTETEHPEWYGKKT